MHENQLIFSGLLASTNKPKVFSLKSKRPHPEHAQLPVRTTPENFHLHSETNKRMLIRLWFTAFSP